MGDVQLLEAEFGWHAERVAEAGLALGLADLVPIACRGSSHPALLAHLARLIGARPGLRVLDGGSGLGGPAPASWREPVVAVEREIARRHGDDPRCQLEARERAAFGRLCSSGSIAPWLLVLERPWPP